MRVGIIAVWNRHALFRFAGGGSESVTSPLSAKKENPEQLAYPTTLIGQAFKARSQPLSGQAKDTLRTYYSQSKSRC